MRKRKLLFVNEASFLSTGYASIGHDLLSRLYASQKYELAELACYGQRNDPRAAGIPWTYIANMPDDPSDPAYQSDPVNQFGMHKFEEACLDFQPDVVVSITDPWMQSYQLTSPFRDYYYHVNMPTCDGSPLATDWIMQFAESDKLLTYTHWAADILKSEGLEISTDAAVGVDLENFQPIQNKKQHKAQLGLRDDIIVVGMCARNQRRKLYPDLFDAAADFLKYCVSKGNKQLADRTYFYFHTSYPDVGWDIPRLLIESGLSNKVLFTYLCKNCGSCFPSLFQDSRSFCQQCGQLSAAMPNSTVGVPKPVLNTIYNLFDVYVQYASNEGLGVPVAEAAACGVHPMVVDYSGMSDFKTTLKATPINVQRYYKESDTGRMLACPDNSDFVTKLYKFLSLPEGLRQTKGYESRKLCELHYNWNGAAQRWMDVFDSLTIRDLSETWSSGAKLFQPQQNVPQGLSAEQLVAWAICNVLGQPEKLNSYYAAKTTRDLSYGARVNCGGNTNLSELSFLGVQPRWEAFDPAKMLNEMAATAQKRNHWETMRVNGAKRGI